MPFRKLSASLSLIVLLSILMAPAMGRAERFVASYGSWFVPGPGVPLPNFCDQLAFPCPELALAVAFAQPGETVYVLSDLSLGSVNLPINKLLTIQGNLSGNARVTLDAAQAGRHFDIRSQGNVTLINLNLINGSESSGGAVRNLGSLTLLNSWFRDNNAMANGGAIFVDANATLITSDSGFSHNSAQGSGGAIYAGGDTTVQLIDTDLDDNVARRGGGIFSSGVLSISSTAPSSSLDYSTFSNNRADQSGGGIYYTGAKLDINDVELLGNTAELSGGAIYCSNGIGSQASGNIAEATFSQNLAVEGGAIRAFKCDLGVQISDFSRNVASRGGAMALEQSRVTIDATAFQDNAATEDGGGIKTSNEFVTVSRSFFARNAARLQGGAIWAGGGNRVTAENSTFDANRAEEGGAFFNQAVFLDLDHNTLVNSVAVTGPAIYNANSTLVTLDNSIVDGSLDPGGAPSLACYGQVDGTGNLVGALGINDSTCGGNLGRVTGLNTASSVEETYTGTAYFSLDPASNAVDAGIDCVLVEDQRGFPRDILSADGKLLCDIGSYEVQ